MNEFERAGDCWRFVWFGSKKSGIVLCILCSRRVRIVHDLWIMGKLGFTQSRNIC